MWITSYKAQPIGSQVIEPLTVEFHQTLPSPSERWISFDDEAQRIANALRASLPGGLYDALAMAMMRPLCSKLIVPHPAPPDQVRT